MKQVYFSIVTSCFLGLTSLHGTSLAKENVLKYSEDGTPTTLDPVQSATTYSNLIVSSIYDTLFEYKYLKIPYELKPNLAAAMPKVSDDGLVYTIKIKSGVRFSDNKAFPGGKGREVVAEDFVYSLKRHFDPANISQGSWLWRGRIKGLDDWKKAGADYSKEISGLKAIDKHTIQLTLNKPYPQILYTFAMGYSAVVPKEAVETYGKQIAVNPVGSGPFRLEDFNTQKAVLVKNENYRKETLDLEKEGYDKARHGEYQLLSLNGKQLPILDRVEVNFIKQETARWNSFTKGSEVQFTTLPKTQVARVLKNRQPVELNAEYKSQYNYASAPEFGFVYNAFNMADETFGYSDDPMINKKNRAVRCAIRKAFNWRQRIDQFYLGIGEPFPGVIPPTLSSYSELSPDAMASTRQDIPGARKLLASAGVKATDLPTFKYGATASVTSKQIYEQFRGFLKNIGYPRQKIKYRQFANFGDYNKALKNAELPIVGLGWGLDYPDAENLMQLFYGPNSSPGSNNANYKNPDFDRLYELSSNLEPGPKRREIYKQMSEILIDDCVLISGFSRTRVFMWHKDALMVPSRSPHGSLFKYFAVK